MRKRNDNLNQKSSRPKQQPDYNPNSAASQRRRLHDYMREQPITTIEARRDLDILAPAARIKELRDRGFLIHKQMVDQETQCGRKHKVAKYFLIGEAVHG